MSVRFCVVSILCCGSRCQPYAEEETAGCFALTAMGLSVSCLFFAVPCVGLRPYFYFAIFKMHMNVQNTCTYGTSAIFHRFNRLIPTRVTARLVKYIYILTCCQHIIERIGNFTWSNHLSRGMRFPAIWYVRPAKAQTSLRIRAD